jgi:hypothetical protein
MSISGHERFIWLFSFTKMPISGLEGLALFLLKRQFLVMKLSPVFAYAR